MPKSLDKPFKWDDAIKETALNLVFEGRLAQADIAKRCNIAPRTLAYWIAHPDFQRRLEAKRADLAKALEGVTYADKARRIIALDQMAESARATYEEHTILYETRPVPKCDEPMVTEHYNRDAFESFRGALDDIAKELGQRKTTDITINNTQQQQQVLFVLPDILNEADAATFAPPGMALLHDQRGDDNYQATAWTPGAVSGESE